MISARVFVFLLFLACSCFGYRTNLIPNSSFEVGPGRGWIQFQTSGNAFLGNTNFYNDHVTNATTVHGGFSMRCYNGAPVTSRAFYATSGVYCLSWSQKSVSGATLGGTYAYVSAYSNNAFIATSTHAADGTWTRVSTNVTLTYDGYYKASISAHLTGDILIDAVQFEAGTSPTTYSPSAQIECAVRVGGIYGMWFLGNSPTFEMRFRNEGPETNIAAEYRLFDYTLTNYLTHSFRLILAAGTNTSTNVSIPRFGWTKIYTRLRDVVDSSDEATTIYYNFPSNTTANADTDWLGGHPHVTPFHAVREAYAGRRIARSLSPGSRNTRWWHEAPGTFIEESRGNMVFNPAFSYTNWQQAGLIGLGCFTAMDAQELPPSSGIKLKGWPPWAITTATSTGITATNAAFPYVGMWNGMDWSNYQYWVTFTNKHALRFAEIGPNESYQTGPNNASNGVADPFSIPSDTNLWVGADNLPLNVVNPTNYVKVFATAVWAVTNADPTMKIIFGSGAAGSGDWAWSVWTNLNNMYPGVVPWVYAVSNHRYQNDIHQNPNAPFYIGVTSGANQPMGWMDKFKGIRPVWNTENNTAGPNYTRGLNGLHNVDLATDFEATGDESLRWEESNRQRWQLDTDLSGALRDIGFGFHKTFWYDSRFNDSGIAMSMAPNSAITTPADMFQVDKPALVARSICRHMIDAPGYGAISNSFMPFESYMFTNAVRGWSVAASWSASKTNLSVRLTNAVAVLDCMGNTLGTNTTNVLVQRTPIYLVSSSLTVQVLSNTLKYAVVIATNDSVAPQVSIDIAPTGPWDGSTNQALFKWSGLDDTVVQYPGSDTTTNVLFSYKLNGSSYSTPSQSNHVWLDHIPSGTNTFWVKAWDKSGNENEVSYDFVPILAPDPPANLHVIGTFNVGTIDIVP